jgi:hypothetical protein
MQFHMFHYQKFCFTWSFGLKTYAYIHAYKKHIFTRKVIYFVPTKQKKRYHIFIMPIFRLFNIKIKLQLTTTIRIPNLINY